MGRVPITLISDCSRQIGNLSRSSRYLTLTYRKRHDVQRFPAIFPVQLIVNQTIGNITPILRWHIDTQTIPETERYHMIFPNLKGSAYTSVLWIVKHVSKSITIVGITRMLYRLRQIQRRTMIVASQVKMSYLIPHSTAKTCLRTNNIFL